MTIAIRQLEEHPILVGCFNSQNNTTKIMCLAAVFNKKLNGKQCFISISPYLSEEVFVALKHILAKWKITKTLNTKPESAKSSRPSGQKSFDL